MRIKFGEEFREPARNNPHGKASHSKVALGKAAPSTAAHARRGRVASMHVLSGSTDGNPNPNKRGADAGA